ncbi:hypothetical protein [Aliivibrio salmonicida]|uniref:hypothetical protein n=1 Tax=Aliivibrio salmonicida TaxID=40269 RepID=UPI003D0DA98A
MKRTPLDIELIDGVRIVRSKVPYKKQHELLQCDTHVFDSDIAKHFKAELAYGHPNCIKAVKKRLKIKFKNKDDKKPAPKLNTNSADCKAFEHNGPLKRSYIAPYKSTSALTADDLNDLILNYRCPSCGDVWEKEDCDTRFNYVYCPVCGGSMFRVRD